MGLRLECVIFVLNCLIRQMLAPRYKLKMLML
ncbi:hypothetical protein RDABS01_036640 [Bienertia sinuspersici]